MGICLSLAQEPVAQERPQIVVADEIPISKRRLSKVDPKDIPDVPNKDLITKVRVIDVHDGDTIKVLFEFGGEIMKISIRILGVDTPEVTAGAGRLPAEKVAGLKAKEFVKETLHKAELEGGIHIVIKNYDMYGGRLLAEVHLPGNTTLTELLIKQGYARPYYGEKKKKWTLEELTSPPFV